MKKIIVLGLALITSTVLAGECDLELEHDNNYCNTIVNDLRVALMEKGYNVLPMEFEVGHNYDVDLNKIHFLSNTSSSYKTIDGTYMCVNWFRYSAPGHNQEIIKVRSFGTRRAHSHRTIRRLMRRIPDCNQTIANQD